MEYRRLGDSGLEVSSLCLGTMMFGDPTPDDATAREIIAHARDAGVNFIDTADVYDEGRLRAHRRRRRSRRIARRLDPRDQGRQRDDAKSRNDGGLSRRWILRRVRRRASTRLGARLHRHLLPAQDDPDTPLDETVGAIGELIRAGKIRYFGVSNFRGWRIAEVVHRVRARRACRARSSASRTTTC